MIILVNFFYEFSILLNFLGVLEFDNESSSLATFEELTERKIDSEKSDLENFDWKKSKSFKVDSEDVEIMLRISDEEVINNINEFIFFIL